MMPLQLIGAGYLGVGLATAVVLGVRRRIGAVDAILLVVLWPLFGPLLAIGNRDRDAELLAGALPDPETARALSQRLRDARARLAELDVVLARPDFDPAIAQKRAGELAERGATGAAAAAQLRVKTLGQLATLRERYRRELEEVGELMAQLVTQAELVRLGNAPASSDLVDELVARVEGLGELDVEYPVGESR
jgi:hypothetical protein